MPENNINIESMRKTLCTILACDEFCPKCDCSKYCKDCQQEIEKADKLADQILQVLDDWENKTPWPD